MRKVRRSQTAGGRLLQIDCCGTLGKVRYLYLRCVVEGGAAGWLAVFGLPRQWRRYGGRGDFRGKRREGSLFGRSEGSLQMTGLDWKESLGLDWIDEV